MISEPPIASALPVNGNLASWTKPWANFLSETWQAVNYFWFSPAKTVTTAYTIKNTDSVILINGDITVTLPAIKQAGPKRITVKMINAGGGTRTISGNGANIDGAATLTSTTQFQSFDLVPDESFTFWNIV